MTDQFSAADMATAKADGFRASAAEVAKLRGQRMVLCSLLGECLPVIDALMQMPGDDDSDARLNGLAGRITGALNAQPAQFDWATELLGVRGRVTLSEQEAHEIGARLRSMGEKLKVYEDLGDAADDVQLLRMGYAAARLEIESLRAALATPQPSPTAQAADSVPAIQGETNVQLDIDSNHSAPRQQRDVARSVALGQPMGNGSDQVAGHPSAQGDKLLTVAERNIRSFLRSAQFKGESDREAALNCVDVLWAAARAPADSVLEDAARYRFLRDGEWRDTDLEPFIRLQLNTLWDAKIDAARAAQEGKTP